MQKLIIDRSKWRCGGNEPKIVRLKGLTSLYNDKGFSCCLGFYCRKIGGIRNNVLLDTGTPDKLKIRNFTKIELLISRGSSDEMYCDSKFTENAIEINDDPKLSNEEREAAIIKHFKNAGVKVVFKNKYP